MLPIVLIGQQYSSITVEEADPVPILNSYIRSHRKNTEGSLYQTPFAIAEDRTGSAMIDISTGLWAGVEFTTRQHGLGSFPVANIFQGSSFINIVTIPGKTFARMPVFLSEYDATEIIREHQLHPRNAKIVSQRKNALAKHIISHGNRIDDEMLEIIFTQIHAAYHLEHLNASPDLACAVVDSPYF